MGNFLNVLVGVNSLVELPHLLGGKAAESSDSPPFFPSVTASGGRCRVTMS
jgi:hypothetical protein